MTHSGIQLIVGLGNPGEQYEHTRHNAGCWFIHDLAHQYRVTLRYEPKFQGFHSFINEKEIQLHLLIPTTYMNHSGQAVKAIAQFYKIPNDRILVVHDEIDLIPGDIRLKRDGGDGGHNGLKDIISHLNTKTFYRLRIGVGHPGSSHAVHDYVLSRPSKSEREIIQGSLINAYEIVPLLLKGEFQKATQKLHTSSRRPET